MKVKDLVKYLRELPQSYDVHYYHDDAFAGRDTVELLHVDMPKKIEVDKKNKRIILDLKEVWGLK